MRLVRGALIGFSALVAAWAPVRAEAQVIQRGPMGITCAPGATSIAGETCDGTSCSRPRFCVDVPDFGRTCLDPVRELLCFAVPDCDLCPLLETGELASACAIVSLVGGDFAVCVYDPALVCIADETTMETLHPCYPGEEGVPDLSDGDCDGDGALNGVDGCVCEPAADPSGCVTGPIDAGVNRPDAGALDASLSRRDGSSSRADGGGTVAPPGVSFRGGGGCSCAAARSGPLRWPLALTGVVVPLARRRQARGRGSATPRSR